jgi:hypothetical protein
MSLHPHVQVMNHGLARIEAEGGLTALDTFRDDDFSKLVGILIRLSEDGARGVYGGSILHSHAFDDPTIRNAYAALYGNRRIKQDISVVLWKEGGRLRRALKDRRLDPVRLATRFPKLIFITPIRNPIEHAVALAKFFDGGLPDYLEGDLPDRSIQSFFRYIMRSHAEFLEWQETLPAQFLSFGEADVGTATLVRIADTFGLAPSTAWLKAVETCFVVRRTQNIDDETARSLRRIGLKEFWSLIYRYPNYFMPLIPLI